MADRHVIIYTDGACEPNPGPGGIGVVLLLEGGEEQLSQGYQLTTNNRMELTAGIAEGDYVVLHTFQEWLGDEDYATIDISGFDENEKIIEHWDVLQIVPQESANDSTMF